MKIGFSLPGAYAVSPAGNGVRAQAEAQALALEAEGHTVRRLDPWEPFSGRVDVVQFFMGGVGHYGIERTRRTVAVDRLVFAPIIDSNVGLSAYRWAARLGAIHPRLLTIPGVLREQALAADRVICRSEHERRRVTEGLGVPLSKCRVVLNGVDSPRGSSPALARRQFNLPAEYALHVSAYTQPRKNVVRLIEAVGPTGYPLVLAGNEVEGPTLQKIRSLQLRYSNVLRLGFVSSDQLASLYSGCSVFCLPSLHEGTGLAALEAASYGARVVVTENGGAPEYFLDQATYVDPLSLESIRGAFEQTLTSPKSSALQTRLQSELSWRASAQALLRAYED